MSAGDPTDTRCRFVHPPEAIRCVRTVQRGTLACDMHQDAIGAPGEDMAAGRPDAAYDKREADRRREVPGTSVQVEELHDRIAVLEQRNGALDANAEAAKQRLARLHQEHDRVLDEQRALMRRLEAEVRAGREEAERTAKVRAQVAELLAERDRWWAPADQRETEDRALQVLGITRGQVNTGQAVALLGHVYVRRDAVLAYDGSDAVAGTTSTDPRAPLTYDGTAELQEAQGGLFVPVPAGYHLSVSVAPWDSTPELPELPDGSRWLNVSVAVPAGADADDVAQLAALAARDKMREGTT